MKINKIFFIILAITLTIPQFTFAQTPKNQSTAAFAFNESWKPINEFSTPKNATKEANNIAVAPPLVNVLNGVSFYSKKSECNSEQVILLKVINSNNYPVKISWKMSANTPDEFVIIPALKDYEGTCSTENVNKAKLMIKNISGPDKAEIKKYAISHIIVTKAEK